MAEHYARCTNVANCRKTGPDDLVAFDATIGGIVLCSECGRRLTPVSESPERSLDKHEILRQVPVAASPHRRASPRSAAWLITATLILLLVAATADFFISRVAAPTSEAAIRVCGTSTMTTRVGDDVARAFFETQSGTQIQMSTTGSGDQTTISALLPGASQAAQIQITSDGSSDAFTSLVNGSCDLVVSLRPIQDDEASWLPAVRGRVIGRDALVVAVSPDGFVNSLSEDQLRGIFAGEMSSWSQVGGPAHKIDVIVPDDPSEYEVLSESLFDDADPTSSVQRLPLSEITSALASDPYAIAIDSYAALGAAHAIRIIGNLNDIVPNRQSIQRGTYPFTTQLYAYTEGEKAKPQLLAALVAYLRSAPAGRILRRDGLITAR